MTKKIIGCSFDGLKDRCFLAGEDSPRGDDFHLSDVVLPDHHGGRMLAGNSAERSRVSTGMIWPPEAQVSMEKGQVLRRIPISWAWRLLVDAKDKKFLSWSTGSAGASFPIAKVLAVHAVDRLGELYQDKDDVIVAIPNDLDEFGQDALLRELTVQGIGNSLNKPKLVWRPVAAALAWLDKVQGMFHNLNKNDFILVIHIGPDGIEFVVFEMREKTVNGKIFILPLRKPSKHVTSLSGCDWAAEFIQQILAEDDPGAFWQAFTGFPEIWRSLAQISWNEKDLPRIWSSRGEWNLWDPAPSCQDALWQLPSRHSVLLKNLSSTSCAVNREDDQNYQSWAEAVQSGIKNTLAATSSGQLLGVILSGPLMSSDPDTWLKPLYPLFQERGLNPKIVTTPVINTIWCPGHGADVVSEGAAIYGERLSKGEPTYLDTLSQLFILANYRGRRKWFPLLRKEDLEIQGGNMHKNILTQAFSLPHGKKILDVWLTKNTQRGFKKAQFHFAYSPESDMPLSAEIRMASANGLAQIELIPEDKEFLGGQRVFLDYSYMQKIENLPPEKLGFPSIEDLPHDPHDVKLLSLSFKNLSSQFLKMSLEDPSYYKCIEELKAHVSRPYQYGNQRGRIVDKNGMAGTEEGQEIVEALSAKLSRDFMGVLAGKIDKRYRLKIKILRSLLNTSTWLYTSASAVVKEFILSSFRNNETSNLGMVTITYAAGRCLSEVDEMRIFYRSAINKIRDSRSFPVYWPAAIYRLMSLREFSPDALQRIDADMFVRFALGRMQECVEDSRFENVFFQVIKMFLYILRYREIDPNFLSPSVQEDRDLFAAIIRALEAAKKHFNKKRRGRREELAEQLMVEIKNFMYYEGSENIIGLLQEFSADEDEVDKNEDAEGL